MKKFLLAIAAIAVVAFVGCKKDKDEASDALSGTSWTMNSTSQYESINETILFQAGGKVTIKGTYQSYGEFSHSESYTDHGIYTYDEPNVSITVNYEDGKHDYYNGVVYGSYMVLDGYTYNKN